MSALYLSRLTVSHFRSHQHTVLDIGCNPIAIFGANGVGKTNLIEAISMLSPGRGLRRAKVQDLARQEQNIGWKVTAHVHALGNLHEIETSYSSDLGRSVLIDGKAATQTALGRIVRMVWLVPVMDRLWQDGAQARRQFIDRITLSFEPQHAELSTTYERSMRERNRLIAEGVHDSAWFDALERRMAQTGSAIETNRLNTITRILSAQDKSQTDFPAVRLRLCTASGDEVIADADQLCSALAQGRSRDMAAGRCLIGSHRSDLEAKYCAKNLPVKYCSTGEQKALLVNVILSSARALADESGVAPILLLDEVAAHLDSARRSVLYDEICALGAQAWMTGTEAELFTQLGYRATHLSIRDEQNGSVIERIAQ